MVNCNTIIRKIRDYLVYQILQQNDYYPFGLRTDSGRLYKNNGESVSIPNLNSSRKFCRY